MDQFVGTGVICDRPQHLFSGFLLIDQDQEVTVVAIISRPLYTLARWSYTTGLIYTSHSCLICELKVVMDIGSQ